MTRYARAYLDFFEDEVVRSNYDWKRVIQRYVCDGDEPLLSGMISGACHPLIHLAYAYELNNVEVAAEGASPLLPIRVMIVWSIEWWLITALAVACIDRDFLYKYIDAKQKYKTFARTQTPSQPAKSISEILELIRKDTRFDDLFESPGYWNIPILFVSREEIILEYFNLWAVTRTIPILSSHKTAFSRVLVDTHIGPRTGRKLGRTLRYFPSSPSRHHPRPFIQLNLPFH